MTRHLVPELATPASEPPEGPGWVHEIKYDGYRILAWLENDHVTLVSRNGLDWTDRFTEVARSLSKLGARSAILDGEVVVEEAGKSSFQALQNYLSATKAAPLTYVAFDLLALEGEDLRDRSLLERKQLLKWLVNKKKLAPLVRFGPHVAGDGPEFLAACCAQGFEGTISKRAAAPYTSGRSRNWVKCKCSGAEEFVIGGFTLLKNADNAVGALLLGRFAAAEKQPKKKLEYCGKVGTGFSTQSRRALYTRLTRMKQGVSPFARGPSSGTARKAVWVKPRLLAQIKFTEFTSDGYLRHPSYLGLREDKSAADLAKGK